MKPKTQEKKAIAPKITSDAADWYGRVFPNLHSGATFILDAVPHLYAQSLAELRGRFSRGELGMIMDVLNGHSAVLVYLGSPSLVGQHLDLSMADSFALYPGLYEDKWDIPDPQGFLARIAALCRWHRVCLEIWAAAFWQQHELLDLESYIGELAGPGHKEA